LSENESSGLSGPASDGLAVVKPVKSKHPGMAAQRGPRGGVPAEVRIRARASYASRIAVLESIADGTAKQTVTRKRIGAEGVEHKEVTSISPNAKERVLALTELAKFGRIHDDPTGEGAQADEDVMRRALVGALSDPSVRQWLTTERPEVMAELARVALQTVANSDVLGQLTSLPALLPASTENVPPDLTVETHS
jgi:hypothetical protein